VPNGLAPSSLYCMPTLLNTIQLNPMHASDNDRLEEIVLCIKQEILIWWYSQEQGARLSHTSQAI